MEENIRIGLRVAASIVLFSAVEDVLNGLIDELPARFPNRILAKRRDEPIVLNKILIDGVEQIRRDQLVAWCTHQKNRTAEKKLQILYEFVPPPDRKGKPIAWPMPNDVLRLKEVRNDAAHGKGGMAVVADLDAMLALWTGGGPLLILWMQEHIDNKFEIWENVHHVLEDK